jgi:hypothetical protein
MFGHFGFSYVGCIYLLMLFIPNILWIKHKPSGYEYVVSNENKTLLAFERVGQVLVTCVAVFFNDYNVKPFSLWSLWLILSLTLMIIYEINWVKYFNSKHSLKDFYGSFLGIPVAGASLPVVAFLLLGIYGRVIWLIISTIILGIGHIGIQLQHLRESKTENYEH